MSTATHFQPHDDLLHDISGTPHARESLFWVLPLPADELAVMAYAWRDGESDTYGRLIAVGGPDVHAPIVLDVADGLELEGDDLDDCVIGGLHIRQPEPLRVAEISFDGDDVAFQARVEALHEPFSWHQNADGCPPWAATDRYEQSVRTSGTLRLQGREPLSFSGVGHRDHSWGSRDWRALQHWKWMNATTVDGGVSLHAWESLAYADRHVLGYVNRGGNVAAIHDIDVTTELDDRLVHRVVRAVILDVDGGETVIEATRAAGVQLSMAQLYMNEIAMTATIDGAPAVAHIEFGWLQDYVNLF